MLWRFRQGVRQLIRDARALRLAVRGHGKAARAASGKSLPAQVAEIIALRHGAGRLAPDEYYQYCLFDDRRFTWMQKRAFLGRQMEYDLWKLFNCERWTAIAHDKLVAYSLFEALGLPSPKIYAVFHPNRHHGSVPVTKTPAELGHFLREKGTYPAVIKPVMGMWGQEIYAIECLDHERDEFVFTNADRVPVDLFLAKLAPRAKDGYVIQELLKPHPGLKDLCGPRICSVRMVTILEPKPQMISTLWKVAVGGAMADNYWEPGNLVGPVDIETGQVGQLFTGLGLQRRNVSEHPDTGRRLVGVTLPDWHRALEVCLEGTASLPGLKMQAWDIALTDRGPVLLEVNIIGGVRLPQMVADAGLDRGALREMLRRYGYARKPRRLRQNAGAIPESR